MIVQREQQNIWEIKFQTQSIHAVLYIQLLQASDQLYQVNLIWQDNIFAIKSSHMCTGLVLILSKPIRQCNTCHHNTPSMLLESTHC